MLLTLPLVLAAARPAAASPTVGDGGSVYGSGGDKTWWDPHGVSDCLNNSPIAGTAGYRNARSAITTNATTYGAAQWAQRNLGGRFDVAAAYAWKPKPQLFDAQVAIHRKGYHQSHTANGKAEEDKGFTGQEANGWIVQGGVVSLPDLWYYGVQGGIHGSAHIEWTGMPVDGLHLQMRILYNDPDPLALYPFAYNAVWFSYRLWTQF